jgi:hypothetical protein
MTAVASFAAMAGGVAYVIMTSTLSRTNSAAISAKRSLRPSAQRYSIATVRPWIQPSSCSRCTKAATHWLLAEAVAAPRNPMVGSLPGCCARAASGHVTAAPPSSVMTPRRFNVGPPPPESVYRTLSLPHSGRRVLWTGLNCSEQTGAIVGLSHPPIGGCQHDYTPFGGRCPSWIRLGPTAMSKFCASSANLLAFGYGPPWAWIDLISVSRSYGTKRRVRDGLHRPLWQRPIG